MKRGHAHSFPSSSDGVVCPWHFCSQAHQEDCFKLTFTTPNQNTAERATQGYREGQAVALDWNLLWKEFDGPI